jgi:subfamily B ATP-binding cassette protein MsbA
MSSKKLILKYFRRYPGLVLLTIILGFAGALFNGVSTTLIVPILLNFLGQSVALKGVPPIIQAIMSPFDKVPGDYRLLVMASAIVLTIILKNLSSYSGTLVSSSLTRKITSDMRFEGLDLLLEVDIDFYSQTNVGDLINSLGGEIGRASGAIITAVRMIIIAITVLVFVGLLLGISWQLTVASTGLLSLVALVNQYSIGRAKYFGKQLSEMSRAYSVRVLETLSGIRLVKATGNEKREYERIQKLIRDREQADFQSQVNSAAVAPVSEVSSILALMLIVILGRTFFANQIESLQAVLLTYLLVLFRLLPTISQLNSTRSQYANTMPSVDMVSEFLRRDNKPFMKNGSLPYKKLQEGIHFNKVSFAYPTNDNLVLKDVDLYLPRGTTLALVGGSGAGKSTLADLLPRFYDPISGSITIDGIDLRAFDVHSLRRAMGIVSQETFMFNDSVRHNITYARPDATEKELLAAVKRANAYEFIVQLPQAPDTMIGDRGVLLSGGQRQRLAIARALLQDPEILILDEATSALDTVSERLVQSALDNLSSDRTTLIIAHRLSTVQHAHQIAVLEKGHVVELGTHEELLKKGGYYTRLYSMQFAEDNQDAIKTAVNEALIRTSYEVRTRLNPMIGFLKLVVDDMADSPEEMNELTVEAYQSAMRLLKTLEFLEESSRLK